jgi:hypothetical protein
MLLCSFSRSFSISFASKITESHTQAIFATSIQNDFFIQPGTTFLKNIKLSLFSPTATE